VVAHLLKLAIVVADATSRANRVDAGAVGALHVIDALCLWRWIVRAKVAATTDLGLRTLKVVRALERAEPVHTVFADAAVFVGDAEVRGDAADAVQACFAGLTVGACRAQNGVLLWRGVHAAVVFTDLTVGAVRGVRAEALALSAKAVASRGAFRVIETDRIRYAAAIFASLSLPAVLAHEAGSDGLGALAGETDQWR
jgi:hypothetical protein